MIKDLTTEERILAAAKKIFVRDGYHGARMEDIAKEADVNKALLHYYFRSKDKLFEVIFQELKSGLLPMVSHIFESDTPVFDKIKQFIASYIDLLNANPYLPLFLLNEMNKDPEKFIQNFGIIEKVHQVLPKFVMQIQSEIEKGILKPISPIQLMMNIISMCIMPFVGKPMMQRVMQLDDLQYRVIMEQRKIEVAKFVIDAIKA